MTEPTEPALSVQPDPPWQRPPSPVARGLLWLFSLSILASTLAGAVLAHRVPSDPAAVLDMELRTHNAMWRVANRMSAAEQPRESKREKAAKIHGAGHGEKTPSNLTAIDGMRREALQILFARAQSLTDGRQSQNGAVAIVAHCLATEQHAQAAEFAAKVRIWSPDLATAMAALPAEHTATLVTKAADIVAVNHAQLVAEAANFGAGWSPWTRDRIRLQIAVRAMEGHVEVTGLPASATVAAAGTVTTEAKTRARVAVKRLTTELGAGDRSVVAALFTTLQVYVFGALFGLGMLIAALARAVLASHKGLPVWEWLKARYPGLPADNPYVRDILTPFLGLAIWLGAQGAAGLAIAAVFGRKQSGFAVLMGGMVAVVGAQAAVTLLSPTRAPLFHAARLGGDPAAPFWRASTAALRSWAVLLPIIPLASVISALFFGDAQTVHPIALLAAQHHDPVTIVALGIAAVVLAPLAEELIFRGFLLRYLRQRFGLWPAVAVSSLLFAGMHMAPDQLLPYTVLGVGFALTYVWVGNLWASVVLHGLWNAGSFVLTIGIALS
ncbi:MAG: CPBP family intramembrane metalloprotease [Myxococcales bacterium]|nr:CPBP family intramembrane metalloprotease [Myxococcales bacterium]